MQVQSLAWEDPLEKGMAIHSSILAWRIPWPVEPGGLQYIGSQSQTQLKRLSMHAEGMYKCVYVSIYVHLCIHFQGQYLLN